MSYVAPTDPAWCCLKVWKHPDQSEEHKRFGVLGFRVSDLGFRVWGLGSLGVWVSGPGVGVEGLGLGVGLVGFRA